MAQTLLSAASRLLSTLFFALPTSPDTVAQWFYETGLLFLLLGTRSVDRAPRNGEPMLDIFAELVDSTVGGVKAALNRARTKLADSTPQPKSSRTAPPELRRVMELYVERFNRRDWDSVRELIRADARLHVADAFAGRLADAPYFSNWGRLSMPWRLVLGEVDGEPVAVILQRGADTWTPYSAIRLGVAGHQIQHIIDYFHCPWLLSDATSVCATT